MSVSTEHGSSEDGSIEREIHIAAPPEIVFTVISSPEHLVRWWAEAAEFIPAAGESGHLTFGDPSDGGERVSITVVEVDAPRRFAFRWVYDPERSATPSNSLLVTFELDPHGDQSTVLRMTETGFRQKDWSTAAQQEQHRENVLGWESMLPRLRDYVAAEVSAA